MEPKSETPQSGKPEILITHAENGYVLRVAPNITAGYGTMPDVWIAKDADELAGVIKQIFVRAKLEA